MTPLSTQVSPEDALRCIAEKEVIDKAFNTLTAREALVIKLRYGLTDGTEQTLAEIGQQLDISRERVRQIQLDALKNLRAMMESHGISGDIILD